MNASLWMTLAAVFYALQYFNVKVLHHHTEVSVWTIMVFRGIVGWILSLVMVLVRHRTWRVYGNAPWKLLTRGAVGAATLLCSFQGLSLLRLSIATALLSTTPLWTGLLTACCCSPTEWGWKDTAGALLCMSGVLMITVEEYSTTTVSKRHSLWGVSFCLVSSILNALVNVTVHELKNEDAWIITMYPMACTMLLAAPGALVHRQGLGSWTPLEVGSLFITGGLSVMAQVCRTLSLQHTKHMGVIILRYLDVPLSVFLDIMFLKSRPTLLVYSGISLIGIGGVISLCRQVKK